MGVKYSWPVNTLRGSTSRRRSVFFSHRFPFFQKQHSSAKLVEVRGIPIHPGVAKLERGSHPNMVTRATDLELFFRCLIGSRLVLVTRLNAYYSLLGLDRCLNGYYLGEGHAMEKGEGPLAADQAGSYEERISLLVTHE